MSERLLVKNRKAYHNYQILEVLEAGVELLGTEVKSLREHRVNLKESYAVFRKGELWLEGCHISPYRHGNRNNHEPLRPRKLLLHRHQLKRLLGKSSEKGLTIVPLALYFKGNKIKVRVGLARGKKLYDKREARRRKVIEREIEAELKRRHQ